MSKSFTCGSVISGCPIVFTGVDDDDILTQVGAHAAAAHGIASPPPEVATAVLAAISSVPKYLADAYEGLRLESAALPVQRSPHDPAPTEAPLRSATPPEQSDDLMRRAFRDAPMAIAVTASSGRFLEVNQALCDLLRTPAGELAGGLLDDLLQPGDLAALRSARADLLAGPSRRSQLEAHLVRGDGSEVAVELTCSPVLDGSTVSGQIIYHVQDVTDRRAEQERLTRAAQTDPLTGLPNRATLFEQLELALARRGRRHGTVAVLFCDIDDFKSINDNHGHHVGDAVLVQFAERLGAVKRPTDLAARFAGDEFVVVYENGRHLDTAALVDRLQEVLARPFVIDGVHVTVTTSIGTAVTSVTSVNEITAVALLQQADHAMYAAKALRQHGVR